MNLKRIGTFALLCTLSLANRASAADLQTNIPDRIEFEHLYQGLQDFRTQLHVRVSSRTSDYNACAAFTQIVQKGSAYLPYIVEKLQDGDFFMNQAMAEITQIDVRKYFDEHPWEGGEQHTSKLWLRWWHETKEPGNP